MAFKKINIRKLPDGSYVNIEDGEYLENILPVLIQGKAKIQDFFMANQIGFKDLAKDKQLRGAPRSVLDYLMSILDYENDLKITQAIIAKELDMGANRVSEAIKVLIDKKILLKGPKLGCSWSYRLNHKYGWKGKVKNLEKRKRETNE